MISICLFPQTLFFEQITLSKPSNIFQNLFAAHSSGNTIVFHSIFSFNNSNALPDSTFTVLASNKYSSTSAWISSMCRLFFRPDFPLGKLEIISARL
ncbi:hypothetical protein HOK00_01450 [bacterium]|nr:hypothetical protein [bacterium]